MLKYPSNPDPFEFRKLQLPRSQTVSNLTASSPYIAILTKSKVSKYCVSRLDLTTSKVPFFGWLFVNNEMTSPFSSSVSQHLLL